MLTLYIPGRFSTLSPPEVWFKMSFTPLMGRSLLIQSNPSLKSLAQDNRKSGRVLHYQGQILEMKAKSPKASSLATMHVDAYLCVFSCFTFLHLTPDSDDVMCLMMTRWRPEAETHWSHNEPSTCSKTTRHKFLVFHCNYENSLQVGESHKHMNALWNANTLRCILNQSE